MIIFKIKFVITYVKNKTFILIYFKNKFAYFIEFNDNLFRQDDTYSIIYNSYSTYKLV